MFRAATATLLAAAGLATAVLTLESPAGAADEACTGWAALPASVSLRSDHVVVHATLTETAGCAQGGLDNGGSADLTGPSGTQPSYQQWSKVGDTETIDLYITLSELGRYSISGGSVQVYNTDEERVASSWRTTSMTVKEGSRLTSVRRSHRTLTATVQRYTKFGWTKAAGTKVSLQRYSGGAWHTVARTKSGSSGRVSFGHASGRVRLAVSATSSAWGSSLVVR